MKLTNRSTDHAVVLVVEEVARDVRALGFFSEDRARSLALHGLAHQIKNAVEEFRVDRQLKEDA